MKGSNLRRFALAIAGAAVSTAVIATGAQALQVVPSAGAPAKPAAGVYSAAWQHPNRPFFNGSEVINRSGNLGNAVMIHGSCWAQPFASALPSGTSTSSGGFVFPVASLTR